MSDQALPDRLALLAGEGERFAAAVERGPLDAPIAACPGWDLRALAAHVGGVHRWAVEAVRAAARPSTSPAALGTGAPGSAAELAGWIRAGVGDLCAALAAAGDDAPTWHPFPAPQVTGVWARRQLHETAVHRLDADAATGVAAELDPALAADGIDEYLELTLPRRVARDGVAWPGGSLHVHCTDTAGEWTVRVAGGDYVFTREHAKGDAALRGPALGLLLRLWGRSFPPADSPEVIGDAAVAGEWLANGGT